MNYTVEIKNKMFDVINSTFKDLGVSVTDEITNTWVNTYVVANGVVDVTTLSMVTDAMSLLSKVSLVNLNNEKSVNVFTTIYNCFSTVGLLDEEVSIVIADVLDVGNSKSASYYIERAKRGLYLDNN